MDEILRYSNFLLSVGVILLWITLVIVLLCAWIGSKIEHERFFRAARRSLEATDLEVVRNGIKNDFEVYRSHRFGFKGKTIVEMCQELGRKIKLQEYPLPEKCLRRLEEVIIIFQDEYKIDDEKMNMVIANVQEKSGIEDARSLREYLLRVNAYHAGILFEKDRHFEEMKEKLVRKKWVSNLGYILGIIGSLASIYSIFVR